MGEYKVLITTSGIGSRLGNLTNFTNKSLVRIGEKPAISHVIEHYPPNTKFVITLGHFGNLVKDFLLLAYPKIDFTFVDVKNYKGKGSSLGHSMLQAEPHLQCPFIFHASDTILTNQDSVPTPTYNWCAGSYKENTSQYRTLNLNGEDILYINEKGELNYDYPYIGLCGIKDYLLFWEKLKTLPNKHNLSDVHVINSMLEEVQFKYKKINTWLDIGNTTELNKTRKYFNTDVEVLDKLNESIYFFEDYVIKFFSDKNTNLNRVKRASKLYPLVPKIINHTDNFYKYEKAKGNLFSKSVNLKSFSSLLEWAKSFLWVSNSKDNFDKDCYKFYIEKTLNRIDLYLKDNPDPLNINGENLPPIKELINNLEVDILCDGVPSQFHGDFILDNIIETEDNFKLIDWRQDFAGDLETGDVYYDLAKLNHNLTVNHNIIDRGLYNASPHNCYILCNSTLTQCKKVLEEFIRDNNFNYQKVEILTSLIWLNMSPLHEYPFNKFLFNFGKYNLYKHIYCGE